MKNVLTVDDVPGWYLCDTDGKRKGEVVTRCYFWDGKELRGYEGGHFLCEMRLHRNFRAMVCSQSQGDSK